MKPFALVWQPICSTIGREEVKVTWLRIDQTGFTHRHFLRSEHEPVHTSCAVKLVFCIVSHCPLCDQGCNGFYPHGSSRHVADIAHNTCSPLEFQNIYEKIQIDLTHALFHLRGPGISVGIATDYGLDGPGIESRWGRRDFPHLSRPAVSLTQPPVQWVTGLSRG
jgi:hypothetical protein